MRKVWRLGATRSTYSSERRAGKGAGAYVVAAVWCRCVGCGGGGGGAAAALLLVDKHTQAKAGGCNARCTHLDVVHLAAPEAHLVHQPGLQQPAAQRQLEAQVQPALARQHGWQRDLCLRDRVYHRDLPCVMQGVGAWFGPVLPLHAHALSKASTPRNKPPYCRFRPDRPLTAASIAPLMPLPSGSPPSCRFRPDRRRPALAPYRTSPFKGPRQGSHATPLAGSRKRGTWLWRRMCHSLSAMPYGSHLYNKRDRAFGSGDCSSHCHSG
eukprot:366000-Chlamydomonas_euryale.AAC.55